MPRAIQARSVVRHSGSAQANIQCVPPQGHERGIANPRLDSGPSGLRVGLRLEPDRLRQHRSGLIDVAAKAACVYGIHLQMFVVRAPPVPLSLARQPVRFM